MGVPVVGCHCEVCRSTLPFNRRLRPSVLLSLGKKRILIDAGPDFRLQALRSNIDDLDGVIFTHAHHDHTAAVDELRVFSCRSRRALPCLLSLETLRDLRKRFYYIFESAEDGVKLTTNLLPRVLPNAMGELFFQGVNIKYVTYAQGRTSVNGFRFGDVVYLTDIKEYDDGIFPFLRGVKTLVVGALRYTPSNQHFSVDEAIDFARKVGAKSTWLTHISHELEHEKANAYLPPEIRLSYDGLEVDFEVDEEDA